MNKSKLIRNFTNKKVFKKFIKNKLTSNVFKIFNNFAPNRSTSAKENQIKSKNKGGKSKYKKYMRNSMKIKHLRTYLNT